MIQKKRPMIDQLFRKKKLKNVETRQTSGKHEISNLAWQITINLGADFILLENENCPRYTYHRISNS